VDGTGLRKKGRLKTGERSNLDDIGLFQSITVRVVARRKKKPNEQQRMPEYQKNFKRTNGAKTIDYRCADGKKKIGELRGDTGVFR
jgi:hypothetical protein